MDQVIDTITLYTVENGLLTSCVLQRYLVGRVNLTLAHHSAMTLASLICVSETSYASERTSILIADPVVGNDAEQPYFPCPSPGHQQAYVIMILCEDVD